MEPAASSLDCAIRFRCRRWTASCALALAACGGGEPAPEPAQESSVLESAQGPAVTLAAPALSTDREHIVLSWHAWPEAERFTVEVRREAGAAFDAVEAQIAGSGGRFARGAAWQWDYPSAQVQVRACNRSGNLCVTSNAQPLLEVLLASQSRVVPAPDFPAAIGFAEQIRLSHDGRTLAMGNEQDKSADPAQIGNGSVWVYQRGTDGQWVPEARIQRFHVRQSFGPGMALSSDATTIAIAADLAGGSAGGVGAPEVGSYFIDPPTPGAHSGALYVYRRDEQRQWQLQAYIKAAVPVTGERMGATVALSGDGNRMAATSFARVYLFERSGGTWRQARIFERRSPAESFFRVVLSADGNTLAVAAADAGGTKVLVYRRCPCGDGWRLAAELRSAKPIAAAGTLGDGFAAGFQYDRAVSLSANGKLLAVGAPRDRGAIDDPNVATFDTQGQGSIYLFGEDPDGVWRRHAHLRTRSAVDGEQIGRTVELDAEGKVLLTKGCGYAANDRGVRRNHRADAAAGATGPSCDIPLNNGIGGVAYVFQRDASGAWTHAAAAIPAPREESFFDFSSIALSGNASAFAIGVGSNSTGVPPLRMEVY